MTSPLDGGEIVRGKLWGSLYALRWLIVAAFVAWALAAAVGGGAAAATPWCGAIDVADRRGVHGGGRGPDVARLPDGDAGDGADDRGLARGVRRRRVFAASSCWRSDVLLGNAVRMAAGQLGLRPASDRPSGPRSRGYIAWPAGEATASTCLTTLLIVVDTRLRFDRLAGRMTEGGPPSPSTSLIHGRPEAPVPIDEGCRGR